MNLELETNLLGWVSPGSSPSGPHGGGGRGRVQTGLTTQGQPQKRFLDIKSPLPPDSQGHTSRRMWETRPQAVMMKFLNRDTFMNGDTLTMTRNVQPPRTRPGMGAHL